MTEKTMLSVSRRALLKGSGVALASSVFAPITHAADAQGEETWTGFAICDSCNHMPWCGIEFEAKGNTIIRIRNWKEHPNHFLCSKGLSTLQRLYNPNRLLYPLKRTNPKGSNDPGWVRCSWDEAIKMIAAHLTEIKEKYGPDKVMFYCGDPKEPRPPVMRLARWFGSPNYACESSAACNLAYVHAEELSWGQELAGGPSPKANVLLIMGKNGSWSSPHGFFRGLLAQKARGMKLIVVDPRRTKVAEQADIHLQVKPGTDGALAWGMIRVIIKESLVNQAFVDKWCHGYEELVKYAEKFTPDYVEKETGVPAEKFVAAARMFAKEGPSSMQLPGQSVPHQGNGCNNVRAMSLLMALTGNVDIPGAATFENWPEDYLRWDEGYTKTFIDQTWFNEEAQKKIRIDREFAPVWNEMQVLCSPNLLPEMVEAGRIRAFCGWGANLLIWPSPQQYQEAVRKMDFSFSCDYFYRDETHHDMDLVLPAAMNYERYAPFGVHGRNISVRKPVKPLGEAWEDWKISLTIGAVLCGKEKFFDGDPVKACDSMLNAWGTSYEERQKMLPKLNVCEWFPPQDTEKYAKGKLRFDGKPGFRTPTGKIELFSTIQAKHGFPGLPEYVPPPKPDDKWPLKLINGTRRPYITHSKTRSDQPYLMEIESESTVNIHPADAEARGIKEGDRIWITSPYYDGKVRARARVTILAGRGMIDAQYGWRGDQETQVLIPRKGWDPISGYPCFNDICVQVVKADADETQKNA